LRERLRAQLVLALYRSGRQAEALAAYRAARTMLVEELGLEPGPQLRELYTRILRHDPALTPRPPSNLPRPATRLIGRGAAVARLEELVRRADTRLLTLTGVGGSGKSRLALELADRLLPEFRDGAVFVALAPISDASLVLPTVAAMVGIGERPHESLLDTVARALDGKELLVILDNFEQVLPAAHDLAALLERTSGPTMIVTSRAALRVAAERRFEVPPLQLPSVTGRSREGLLENEAVALFVERATAVNPEFVVTDQNAPAIAEICVRLDGLPLAVELAAARADVLSPLALLARLDDRLELLSAGPHDRPARQQTLRATLDWSHDLLGDRDRGVFRRLAVFSRGADLAAVEAVCATGDTSRAETLDALASLVETSVVRRWDDERGEPRFGMLETIHEYAREKLQASGDEQDARRAHAEHFLHLAEAAYERRLDEETELAAALQADHDNFRAALAWLRERDERGFVRLAGALAWFWNARTHLLEGGARLREALGAREAEPRDRARLLVGAALVETWRGDYEGAVAHLHEARTLWSALGDELESTLALDALAYSLTMLGDRERAGATAAESLEAARRLGRPKQIDRARIMLGLTRVIEGDADGAEPLVRAALASAESRGDRRREMEAHHLLGDCGLIRGECELATRHYAAATRHAWELGDLAQVAVDLEGVAMGSAGAGDSRRAVSLAAAAVQAADELGVDMGAVEFWTAFRARYLEPARERLGPAAETLAAEGRSLSLERAVEAATAATAS
jgi:predicted ATPase